MTISTTTLSTTVGNVYNSTSGNSAITSLTICNYSPSNVQVNLYVVPANGTPDTATIALANLNITSEDTYQLYAAAEKLLLGPNDFVAANASANTAVTVIVSSTTL